MKYDYKNFEEFVNDCDKYNVLDVPIRQHAENRQLDVQKQFPNDELSFQEGYILGILDMFKSLYG